jgi:hypothetical protein
MPGTIVGAVLGVGQPLALAGDKAAAFAATGAVITDMESGGVAEVAAAHGIPFAVLRVVADAAETTLPPAAIAGFGPNGVAVGAVLRELAWRPSQLPALVALAWRTAAAMRALRSCAPAFQALAPPP